MSKIQKTVFGRIFFTATGVMALIAVIIGLFGLIAPDASFAIIGILLGLYLVVAGALRLYFAIRSKESSTGLRVLVGILGVVAIAAGVFALVDRDSAILALSLLIGIGWMADGINYIIMFAVTKDDNGKSKWEHLLLGVVFFMGGLTMILLGNLGFAILFWWVCLGLLVVGAVTIVWLVSAAVASKGAALDTK